jgi:UDP-N-acetylglucosamine:LPS N-acetylglucosamine transferase
MKAKRIAAVASAGGHWIQLMRLAPVWSGHDVFFVTTMQGVQSVPGREVLHIVDANRWTKWKLVQMFMQVTGIVLKRRPDIVITTGAAPGLAAIVAGRLVGARTVWIDSIANSEQVSGSGRLALRLAALCLTQWEHLAKDGGPEYWGAVL